MESDRQIKLKFAPAATEEVAPRIIGRHDVKRCASLLQVGNALVPNPGFKAAAVWRLLRPELPPGRRSRLLNFTCQRDRKCAVPLSHGGAHVPQRMLLVHDSKFNDGLRSDPLNRLAQFNDGSLAAENLPAENTDCNDENKNDKNPAFAQSWVWFPVRLLQILSSSDRPFMLPSKLYHSRKERREVGSGARLLESCGVVFPTAPECSV